MPGRWGGEVGENLVSREGRGEGSHIPYTFSHWTSHFSSVKSTKIIFFFSCYEFIVFCLIIHQEPEPEPFYFEGSEPEPEPFFFEGSEPEPPKIGRLCNSGISGSVTV